MGSPFEGQKVVAFDTETRGLSWWNEDERAFLASWADESGEYHAIDGDEPAMDRFYTALLEADVIVAHNLSFDVHQVRETWGLDILSLGKELHDTDLLSRILFPAGQRRDRGGHGLKNLAKQHLGHDGAEEDAIKDMGREIGLRTLKKKGAYWEVWKAYPETMERYAREDARLTYDLLMKLYPQLLQDARLLGVYQLEMDVCPVLIRAEARGIAVDQDQAAALVKEYRAAERELHERLELELGEEALGGEGSDTALREGLVKTGVPLYRTTDTGELSTAHFALQEFEDSHPVVTDLMEWRRVTKFLSTYLEPAVGREAMHPSFMQAEAWTGRMSCRQPNMQNIPKRAGKEVRSIFVPREDHAFVVADFESIEVRLLAYYLGSRGAHFTQLIEEGLDPHAWMASQLWGGSPTDYEKGTPLEHKRSEAKNGLFAIVYGGGGKRLSDMFKLDPGPWLDEDAPAVVAAKKRAAERGTDFYWPREGWQYREGYALAKKIKGSIPGYYHLTKDRIQPKIEADGFVSTLFGRKQLVGKEKAYVGLNALIQGSAADIMKQAVINVAMAVAPIGGVPILFVHDEIVVEAPKDRAEEAERRVRAAMVSAADFRPRLEVSSSIVTTNYSDA